MHNSFAIVNGMIVTANNGEPHLNSRVCASVDKHGENVAAELVRRANAYSDLRSNQQPRVLIEVFQGVAEATQSFKGYGEPEVFILDWDALKSGDHQPGDIEPPQWVLDVLTPAQKKIIAGEE